MDAYLARAFEETGATGPWLSGYDPRTRVVVEGREYLRFDIGEVEGNIWAEDLSRTLEAKTGRFGPGGHWQVARCLWRVPGARNTGTRRNRVLQLEGV